MKIVKWLEEQIAHCKEEYAYYFERGDDTNCVRYAAYETAYRLCKEELRLKGGIPDE